MIGRLKTLAGRVERMARDSDAARASDQRLISWYCQLQLEESPWLTRIEPSDTDPGTYAAIQATINRARGDDSAAERWGGVAVGAGMPPRAEFVRQRGESPRDWFMRRMAQTRADVRSECDARRRAQAAALERNGQSGRTGGAKTRTLE